MNMYKLRRLRMRLKQYDVSKQTGISQSKLSLIENGYVRPTDEERRKLNKALSIRCKVNEEPSWAL